MDVAVPHPIKCEYVYCWPGVFHVDGKTGAWQWLVESPQGMKMQTDKGEKEFSYGSPSTSVVLDGKPFIAYTHGDRLRMFDVSDPLKPRLAFDQAHKVFAMWAYSTIAFTRGGDILANFSSYKLAFNRIPYKGLDAQGNPMFDLDHPIKLGEEKDPTPRDMKCIGALAPDRATGDIYYLAVTAQYNKMVPAWGADGTGVGRSTADGKPLWFSLSSGGNYMSISSASDGKDLFVLAGKSFGGQIDVFDSDGLRLTTGNWSWPCHYGIGFVDLRYGVQAYLRPDGKVGAYVEDDAIGRFARCRIDGADTIRRTSTTFDWPGTPAIATAPVEKPRAAAAQLIPKIPPVKIDGDWTPWEKAGVVPQILVLPILTYKHQDPGDDLWQTFRTGTAIGALAHDGQNLYTCFLVTDDTIHFDAANPGRMWEFDSVELWLEEEQIGLGMTKGGTPSLFKYRYHDLAGKEWSANYGLPRENVWAAKLDDLSSHPLGRQLAALTGVSFKNKPGYAVMGKIPMAEVKLVGGIAGREGKQVLNMTGKPGEILRVGVSIGGVTVSGREQDFKATWPAGMMFSDPTRSAPFVLGE